MWCCCCLLLLLTGGLVRVLTKTLRSKSCCRYGIGIYKYVYFVVKLYILNSYRGVFDYKTQNSVAFYLMSTDVALNASSFPLRSKLSPYVCKRARHVKEFCICRINGDGDGDENDGEEWKHTNTHTRAQLKWLQKHDKVKKNQKEKESKLRAHYVIIKWFKKQTKLSRHQNWMLVTNFKMATHVLLLLFLPQ